MRNRAKRLVREAFRATPELWPPGVDVVVVVRSLQPECKLEDVVNEWRSMRSKLARHTLALRANSLQANTKNP